jgi:TPR repeat protein
MKALSVLIMVFQLVFGFSGLQNVGADQADEDYKRGLKYYNGEGVTKEYTKALKWYRKAAAQGNASAQNNIGMMYDSGEGVTKDYAEALESFMKAADQGDQMAMIMIKKLQLGISE